MQYYLIVVNSLLPVRSYAFVVPFNSPLYDVFSFEITKLQDSGYIEERRKHYWDDANQCKQTTDSGKSRGGTREGLGGYSPPVGAC